MPTKPWPTAFVLALLFVGRAHSDAPLPTPAETSVGSRLVAAACVARAALPTTSCDSALLLRSETLEGVVDLLIAPGDGSQAVIARDISLHRSLDGQRARLEPGADGTLLVRSEVSSHGRYPWFETLTIGHIEGRYQVIGYHYSTYDRPMGGDFACAVDLLGGSWHATATRVHPETGTLTRVWEASDDGYADATDIEWWSFREPPAHCDQILEEWVNAAP